MSASINTKKGKVAGAYLKRAGSLIAGAAGEYFKDAMPVLSSTRSEAASSAKEAAEIFRSNVSSISGTVKSIKSQAGFKQLSNWFMGEINEFDDTSWDANLSFDDSTDSGGANLRLDAYEASSNKISKAVVESTYKSVQANAELSASIVESVTELNGTVKSGFKDVKDLLGELITITTKNSSTLIETITAGNADKDKDPNHRTQMGAAGADGIFASGMFDLKEYKKMVKENLSIVSSFASMAKSMTNPDMLKELLSPESLTKMGVGKLINSIAPNLEKSLNGIDRAVNDAIVTSLTRLGENAFKSGPTGWLAKAFGIRAERGSNSTGRSTLEMKSIPFDTMTKEYITNAIPGYLRQMLIAMGGPDMVYDARSRSFRTKKQIKSDFEQAMAGPYASNLAPKSVKDALYNSKSYDATMVFELMMNDLDNKVSTGTHRNQLDAMTDNKVMRAYLDSLTSTVEMNKKERNDLKDLADKLSEALRDNGTRSEVGNMIIRNNVGRRQMAARYIEAADQYNVDLSEFSDDMDAAASGIITRAGRKVKGTGAKVRTKVSGLSGSDYTNKALYEIYRKLDRGINVYQVGSDKSQSKPFERTKDRFLKPPAAYNPKNDNEGSGKSKAAADTDSVFAGINPLKYNADRTSPNLLRNNQLEDGTTEDLKLGARLNRWGSKRGSEIRGALMNGSPEEIREAFNAALGDIVDVASSALKKGADKIDKGFGNVSGYLKHKVFGTPYQYTDENGQKVQVQEGKGLVGYVGDRFGEMFKSATAAGSKWFNEVSSYFDYKPEPGEDGPDKSVAAKRRKFLGASVGAFAGAGILGGPIGILAGTIAGSAVGGGTIGKKINKMLFGYDDGDGGTGAPTGIISKAADAVVTPVKYQLGKTLAFAGAEMKKHVFGPLSDLGIAIKDRMKNHVDSWFDTIKKKTWGAVKKVIGGIGKGLAAVGSGIATAAQRASTTFVGKAARTVVGSAGAVIGALTSSVTKKFSKRSYHKLGEGEEYWLKVGESYYDVAEKRIKSLGENDEGVGSRSDDDPDNRGIMLIGGADAQMHPLTKNYIKNRKNNRNESIVEELRGSGFYGGKNRLAGIFGGDYKAYKKAQYAKNKDRRAQLSDALAEKSLLVADDTNQTIKKQADDTKEIKGAVSELNSLAKDKYCIHTHDQAMLEKMDILIDIAKGAGADTSKIPGADDVKPLLKSDMSIADRREVERNENAKINRDFANSMLPAIASMGISGDMVTDQETSLVTDASTEATKKNPNKPGILNKFKSLLRLQREGKEGDGEKKESWISKLVGTLLSHPWIIAAGGAIAGLLGLLRNVDLNKIGDAINTAKDVFDRVGGIIGGIWDRFQQLMGWKEQEEDPTTMAVNDKLAIVDGHVDSAFNLAIPFMGIDHLTKDPAGNRIRNSTLTEVKEELLWKAPARKDLVDTIWAPFRQSKAAAKSAKYLGQAADLEMLASKQASEGGIVNTIKSKVNKGRANQKMRKAEKYDEIASEQAEAATSIKTSAVANVGKTLGKFGVVSAAGGLSGFAANQAAQALGFNEEQAEIAGNVTNRAVSGAFITNMAKTDLNPMNNKKSWATKIVDGFSEFVKKLWGMISDDSKIKKLASKGIGKIDDFIQKAANGIKSKLDDIIIDKITKLLAKFGIENAAAVATAGLSILVTALNGLLDGLCSTEHLFMVLPGDATPGMVAISAAIRTALGALESTPVGFICVILDVIDGILTAIPGINMGLTQFLAQRLYSIFDSEGLEERQGRFKAEQQHVEETYGIHMNAATLNDEINSTGWFDKMISGSATVGDDGFIKRNEAGGALKEGGIASLVTGNNQVFVKDKNGDVWRDAEGNAVVQRDKYGHEVKYNAKWGDAVGNWGQDLGRFLGGGVVYKEDENGNAIFNEETGEYEVDHVEGNVFQRMGAGIENWWAGEEKTNEDGSKSRGGGFKDWAGKKLGEIGSAIASPFNAAGSAVEDWWAGDVEKDEKGEPILGPDNKPIRKGGFKDNALKTLGNIGKTIASPFNAAGSAIEGWWAGDVELDENGEVIRDENGKPIRKGGFKDRATQTLGKIGSSIAEKFTDVTSGIKAFALGSMVLDEEGNPIMDPTTGQPIRQGGLAGMAKSVGGFIMNNMISPIGDMATAAKDWAVNGVKNIAGAVGSGINTAKDWVVDFGTKIWNGVSGPISDAFNGAKQFAGNLFNGAKNIVDGAKEKIKGAKDWVVNFGTGIWNTVSGPISDAFNGAKQFAGNLFNGAKGLAGAAKEKLKDAKDWAVSFGTNLWNTVSSPISDAFNGAKSWVKNTASWLGKGVKDVGSWIKDTGTNIWNTVTKPIKDMAKGAADWVSKGAEWLKDGCKSVGDWISKTAGSVWDFITSPFKALTDAGKQEKENQKKVDEWRKQNGYGGMTPDEEAIADRKADANMRSIRSRMRYGGIGAMKTTDDYGGGTKKKSTGLTDNQRRYAQNKQDDILNALDPSLNIHRENATSGGNPLDTKFDVTSSYHDPTRSDIHHGIDVVPANGKETVHVASRFNGIVSLVEKGVPDSHTGNVGNDRSGGNMVWIDTDEGYRIKNMHLKAGSIPAKIQQGARVSIGENIGVMGSTGYSTGRHLHYQIQTEQVNENAYTVDPYPNMINGAAITPYDGSVGEGDSSTYDTTSSLSENGTTEKKGILAQAIDILKSAGGKIINYLTGGLFGSTDDSSGDGSGAYGNAGAGAAGLLQIAANEIGNHDDGNNNVKYNTWFYGHEVSGSAYPWCMAFVQWCFDKAGYPLKPRVAGCGGLLGSIESQMPGAKIYTVDGNPDVMPQPGDIAIFEQTHEHTGIIESVTDNKHVTTIEGNTSSTNQENGGWVERKERQYPYFWYFVRAVDFAKIAAESSGSGSGVMGTGATLEVPDQYGKYTTFEKENLGSGNTHGWATASNQGQLRLDAVKNNRFQVKDLHGSKQVSTIDNRMMVATTENIGNKFPVAVGDYLDAQFADGDVWHLIKADSKGTESTIDAGGNAWGHNNGEAMIEKIYWDYGSHTHNDNPKKLKKLVKVGHYQPGASQYIPGSGKAVGGMTDADAMKLARTPKYGPSSTPHPRRGIGGQPTLGPGGIDSAMIAAHPAGRARTNPVLRSMMEKAVERNRVQARRNGGVGGMLDTDTKYIKTEPMGLKTSVDRYTLREYDKQAAHTRPPRIVYGGKGAQASAISGSDYVTQSAPTSSSNMGTIVALLQRIVAELTVIGDNTGESSGYLETLNDKDFVDAGLRKSISSLNDAKDKIEAKQRRASDTRNTRTIKAMVTP